MRIGYLLLGLLLSCAAQQPPAATPPPSQPAGHLLASHAAAPPTRRPDEDDFYLAIPRILESLNKSRAAQGVDPIRLDRALCAVAQQGVAVFLQYGGHLRQAGAEQRTASVLAAELDRFHHVYRRVATAVLTTPAPMAFAPATLQPALDAEMAYVGIAVEPLQHEMAVVLIFAQ